MVSNKKETSLEDTKDDIVQPLKRRKKGEIARFLRTKLLHSRQVFKKNSQRESVKNQLQSGRPKKITIRESRYTYYFKCKKKSTE